MTALGRDSKIDWMGGRPIPHAFSGFTPVGGRPFRSSTQSHGDLDCHILQIIKRRVCQQFRRVDAPGLSLYVLDASGHRNHSHRYAAAPPKIPFQPARDHCTHGVNANQEQK